MSITQVGVSGAQVALQLPLPGQRIAQFPRHVTSQPPDPVQLTVLPDPTRSAQGPEPVQDVLQAAPQEKLHAPEPAHCRLQSPRQFTRQSPLLGQMHSEPRHSQDPPRHAPPEQPLSSPVTEHAASTIRAATIGRTVHRIRSRISSAYHAEAAPLRRQIHQRHSLGSPPKRRPNQRQGNKGRSHSRYQQTAVAPLYCPGRSSQSVPDSRSSSDKRPRERRSKSAGH